MPVYTHGIGKGLREPCTPFRKAEFFGAEFDTVSADSWNCIPEISGSTQEFDLSGISLNHEVVVAMVGVADAEDEQYRFTIRWFRERDDQQLYRFDWSYTPPHGGWCYAYSHIGYDEDEIYEDGGYYVIISIRGPVSKDWTINFTVSGITEEPEPPVAPPTATGEIVEAFNSVSAFFYSVYLEVFDWISPFDAIAPFFYEVSLVFNSIAWGLSDFFTWANEVTAELAGFLDWDTIWSYILGYVPNLEDIRDWFYSVTSNVQSIVDDWWGTTKDMVQTWINGVADLLNSRISNLNLWVGDIQEFIDEQELDFPDVSAILDWFTDWPGHIVDTVDTWWTSRLYDVRDLIDSAFTARASLWSGWQDIKGQVVEFFRDPEEWLYNAVDRIVERFW